MKKDMPLEGLRWSRDSGSALYDTPQNGRSRTGWGVNRGLYSSNIISLFLSLSEVLWCSESSCCKVCGASKVHKTGCASETDYKTMSKQIRKFI